MKNLAEKIIEIGVILAILLSNVVMAATSVELQENQRKLDKANQELQGIQSEKTDTLTEVQSLNEKITEYQGQIDELDNKIGDLNNQISEAQSQLDQAQEDFTKQEELLKNRLIATYEAGETTYLDVILSSKGLTDFISNYYLIQEIAQNDKKLLDEIQDKKEQIENAKKTLEDSKNELNTSRTSKQNVQNQLSVAKKEKDKRVAQLSESEQQTQAEIAQLEADNAKIKQELQAAANRYKDKLSGYSDTFTGAGNGYLQRPVQSGSISATMTYSSGSFHGGIDYAVPEGTPVYAAADGVVMTITHLTGSYGEHLTIKHPNGMVSYYAHGNGTFYVSPGQSVKKGQLIMLSGNTGNSSGPHLHFEVRVPPYNHNWTCCVDPRNYM